MLHEAILDRVKIGSAAEVLACAIVFIPAVIRQTDRLREARTRVGVLRMRQREKQSGRELAWARARTLLRMAAAS